MAVQKPKKEKVVTEGFFAKEMEKYVTKVEFKKTFGAFEHKFETAMTSIARSFTRVEEQLDRLENAMLHLIQVSQRNEEEHQKFNKIIADHTIHISRHENVLDNLTERIETIEGNA